MIGRLPRYIGPVVAASLCLGLVIGWFIWGQKPDFPERVLAILEENCQPWVSDEALDTTGLVQVSGHRVLDYGDEATALMVSLSANRDARKCVISDVLQPHAVEKWAQAYVQAQLVWSERLAVLNGEVPAVQNLRSEGVGDPHILIRPRDKTGFYLMFIKFNHDPRTQLILGHGAFNRAVAKEEAL